MADTRDQIRAMLGPAIPPVAGSYAPAPARKKTTADQIRALIGDVPEMLNGTGISERLALANDLLNPLAAIPRAQAASQEMFAPDRTAMQRVASTGNMLGELAGFAAPMAGAAMAGRPAVNALAEGMTGMQTQAGNALDAGRMFAADESGALRLWHGSPHDFDRFDPSKSRTAQHIYTTPNPPDAGQYGRNLYEVGGEGRVGDFTPENRGPNEWNALQSAFEEYGLSDYFNDFDEFVDAFDGGQLYQVTAGQRAQNATIEALLDAGFDGARIPDAGFGGNMSESVVYRDPSRLSILGKDGQRTTPEGKAQTILDMLQSGRAGEVTDEMLDLGDATQNARLNQYLYRNYDLPMDEASRMQRAGEMGFDTDTPLYHGTKSDISSVNPSAVMGGNARGAGFYATDNPSAAGGYATGDGMMRIDVTPSGNPNIIPMAMRGDTFDETSVLSKAEINKIARATNGEWSPKDLNAAFDRAYPATGQNVAQTISYRPDQQNEVLQAAGYSGRSGPAVASSGRDIVSFDPRNIRSRFARFDPRLSHLKNLSAGIGGLGLMGMYQEPDQ